MPDQIDKYSFGRQLQALRLQTSNPDSRDKSRTYLTQLDFAGELTEIMGNDYSENIVQKWESGVTPIAPRERKLLKTIIIILKKFGAITSSKQANELLILGFHNPLTFNERIEIDPEWVPKKRVEDLPFDPGEFHIKKSPLLTSEKPARKLLIPALPPQGVIGRKESLDKILQKFEETAADETADQCIALKGLGGIGKTSLAIAFARDKRFKDLFSDGVLWITLGNKPKVRSQLNQLGGLLGVDLLPAKDVTSCMVTLRSALEDRSMLIVVDDVWQFKEGDAFKIGGPDCRTLFTTRETAIANELVTSSHVIGVTTLKPGDALKLLKKLAPEVVTTDPKNANKLCEVLYYFPLGLTLAGKMLANEVDVPSRMQRLLGELIDRSDVRMKLMQSEGHPDVDGENPVSLQAILGITVNRLSEVDRFRFASASIFGAEPLVWDIELAAGMWKCSIRDAEESVSHFLQRGLVERRGSKYCMHALLVDYGKMMQNNYEK